MKLTIEIDTGNAAFGETTFGETPKGVSTEALRIIGTKIHDVIQEASTEPGIETASLFDRNGNSVGHIEVSH